MPAHRSTTRIGHATATDVAREAGVSQSAVSLVMSGKATGRVAPATVERIRIAAEALEYHPNAAARALRSRTSSLLGLAVLDASHPFYGLVLSAADDAARRAGLALSMTQTRGHEHTWEQQFADDLSSGRLAGGIVFGEHLTSGSPLRAWADRLVFVEVTEPGMRSIALDTAQAMTDVVTHLARLGHQEIAYFAADYPSTVFEQRAVSCAAAATRHDVRLVTDPSWRSTFDVPSATAAAGRLIDDGIGAVVCDDDLLALALHRVAAERGVRVPEDLSIVGHGDLDVARLVHPQLTTVLLPAGRIAEAAVAILTETVPGADGATSTPIKHTLATPLVVRGSTGDLTHRAATARVPDRR